LNEKIVFKNAFIYLLYSFVKQKRRNAFLSAIVFLLVSFFYFLM
jgi:hypothetical protein